MVVRKGCIPTGPREVLELIGKGWRMRSEAELVELVQAIAADPDRWRPLVQHGPERHSESLYADDEIGIWVISWMPGHDTGWHDHAGSHFAVAVAEGDVREEQPTWTDDPDVHRVYAAGDEPAETIHAYSPPLKAMGVYEVCPDGSVRRSHVTWDHTLAAA